VTAAEPAAGAVYHGRATRRLANDRLWVDVLVTAGPRIVRLGLAGSGLNVLAETPDLGWDTPHGRYELIGGHRLWFAPEDPDLVAVPDGAGLDVVEEPDGISLTGRVEEATGLVRSIRLRMPPGRAALELCHELRNVGDRPIELAPWSITQLPLGGRVLLPQRPATPGHFVRPNRTLVLWPYTSWEDPRFRPKDGMLTLDGDAGPDLKLGYFNDDGWVAYARDGALLVRRFDPQPGQPHPDLGCNAETYIGARYVELELLGPLVSIEPGSSAVLVERWQVAEADPGASAADLQAAARELAEAA
jgi:hypothetical protein